MIEIIPAIDIIGGKCVRLSQGDFTSSKVYDNDPVTVAKRFEDAGIKRLHMVDLDGAKNGKTVNLNTLEKVATNTQLVIDFGGGIKTDEDIAQVFNAGAMMVNIGSIAIKQPETVLQWIAKYGGDKIMLGADVKDNYIMINGWTDTTDKTVTDFITYYKAAGIKQVFCTDITKDGMLQGTATTLYNSIIEQFPDLHLIASGGVAGIEDIETLDKIGCKSMIVGKALYEGRIALNELKKFLA